MTETLIGKPSGAGGMRRAPAKIALRQWLAPAAVFFLVAFLETWNLTLSPVTWYDEGINMQAARNLARAGGYGLVYSDSDGLRPFDLQLTTGPTVIAPVALSFKIVGVGLAQGRAVIVVYALISALGLYRVGRALYGPTAALVALVALCATEGAGPGATRDVVGEVAALACFFWGVDTFIRARATGSAARYATAGLLFGLAILTKGQFGLLLPCLAAIWLLTRTQDQGLSGRHLCIVVALSIVPVVLWQLYQLLSIGVGGYINHFRDQSAAVSVSAIAGPLRGAVNARFLLLSPPTAAGLVGLLYLWLTTLHRGLRRERAEQLLLLLFASLWAAWYVGVSVGYARYTIPLVTVCTLFLGVLYRDLVIGVRASLQASQSERQTRLPVPRPLRTALVLVLAMPLVAGITVQLATVARPPDAAAQHFAAAITSNVNSGAVVESFEWQLDVLADQSFHHPPPFVPVVPYDVPSSIPYLVDGPMSKAFSIYQKELKQQNYARIASAGGYDLYQRQ